MICVWKPHGDRMHIIITKRHFIKAALAAFRSVKQDDRSRYTRLHWLYQSFMQLRHDMLWVFHLLKGALISNGTVVSTLADKRRHIGGSELQCRPISRECQLTNAMAASWSKTVSASLLQPKQTSGLEVRPGLCSPRKSSCGDWKDGGRRLTGEISSRIIKK